jgi:Flp pilus assembly protein CpaB
VRRRARALAFLLLAGVAAALAAGIANGYGSSVARGYGPLRPAVVAARDLKGGEELRAADVASGLEVRRIPARFVPPTTLFAPEEALGLAPVGDVPAGGYLGGDRLRPPAGRDEATTRFGPARHPVEIAVSGAEALLAAGPAPRGSRVDVVVTTEPTGAGRGRTYVAAAGVPLLALGPGADGPGPGGSAAATLALTKRQALRLIAAESFARRLTLLPRG